MWCVCYGLVGGVCGSVFVLEMPLLSKLHSLLLTSLPRPSCSYTYTAEDVSRLLQEKKAKGQAPRNMGEVLQSWLSYLLSSVAARRLGVRKGWALCEPHCRAASGNSCIPPGPLPGRSAGEGPAGGAAGGGAGEWRGGEGGRVSCGLPDWPSCCHYLHPMTLASR